MKNIKNFHQEMNSFIAVKYFCILHGRVCVMHHCGFEGRIFFLDCISFWSKNIDTFFEQSIILNVAKFLNCNLK